MIGIDTEPFTIFMTMRFFFGEGAADSADILPDRGPAAVSILNDYTVAGNLVLTGFRGAADSASTCMVFRSC